MAWNAGRWAQVPLIVLMNLLAGAPHDNHDGSQTAQHLQKLGRLLHDGIVGVTGNMSVSPWQPGPAPSHTAAAAATSSR